jgi:aromatic ring-opening dioxygenase LigB subunit
MVSFACISPHPPIILPSVGSEEDRKKVKKTIENLEKLGDKLTEVRPQSIIISSPHPDWGFRVPLYFLAKNFQGKVEKVPTGLESPEYYFEEGKKLYNLKIKNWKLKIALIASGDLSHCLKKDGPYGLHPDGPKFDKDLIEALKKKDIEKILKLDNIYSEAGECGLRPICFILGILEAHSTSSGQAYQPEILSYEYPFGVGYLVANFKLL